MNIFEKIVHFLDADMTTPALYGTFHLVSLALVVLVTAFLILKFRNAEDKTFRKVVLFFWVIIAVLEVYKQIDFTFNYNDGAPYWDYQWYAFPFQFCSTSLYVLPFIFLLRDGKVRDAFISFVCYFSLIAGIAVMAYPGNVLISTIGINIQTMFHHGSQVALGIYFAAYKRKKIGFKFMASAFPILLGFVAVALIMNIGVHSWLIKEGIDETFNMFYISPYHPSPLPVFSLIYPHVPYFVFLLLYLLAMFLGGIIVLGIQKLIVAFGRKIKELCERRVITVFAVLFFLVEALLGAAIQFAPSNIEYILCFLSVALAALFALLTFKKNKCGTLTLLGLIFTVAADVFLVLMKDGDKLIAMYLFTCVQLFYFIRVFVENRGGRVKKNHIVFRIELLFIAFIVTLAVLGEKADALSIVSMLYFTNLFVNIVFSFKNFKRAPSFAIGLLLFAFCDILVGFSLLDLYIPISETSLVYKLAHTDINLIWAFYVPSQTLIALSSRTTEK